MSGPYGVISSGFALKCLTDLLAEYTTAYQAILGDPPLGADGNLDSQSVVGHRADLETNALSLLWEGLQLAYNSAFPSLCDEGSIDNVMYLAGLTRKPATPTVLLCDCVFSDAGTVPTGALIANKAGSIFEAVSDIVATGAGTFTGNFACIETGPTPCPPSDPLTIQTPESNWTSVAIHDADFGSVSLGTNQETLAEARVRRANSLMIAGNATLAAIAAAVENNVSTVAYCVGIDNVTNPESVTAPGYIDIIVQSQNDVPDDVEKQAIADQIWAKRAGGILMQGSISKTVTDSTGKTQTVKFDYVTSTTIAVVVNYSLFPKDPTPPPSDIGGALTAALTAAFAAQAIGEDVLYLRIAGACSAVPGIKINSLTLNGSSANVTVTAFSRGVLGTVTWSETVNVT